MTTQQKNMLLSLVEKESDSNYPDGNYDEWNDIYWELVKLDTEDEN